MFKHHRFALEVHNTGSISGGAAPIRVPTAPPPAPAGAPAPAAPGAPAPPPAGAPVAKDTADVKKQELAAGKKPDLAAYDADGDGDFSPAEFEVMRKDLKAGAAKPAGGAAADSPENFEAVTAQQEPVPPIPPFNAADKTIKSPNPATAAQQADLKARFAKLTPAQQDQAKQLGYDESKLNDAKEGPGTRASANALATIDNKAATDRNTAAQKAADEQNAAAKAKTEAAKAPAEAAAPAAPAPPPTTIPEVNAVNQQQQTEINQLKAEKDRDSTLNHVMRWRDGGNYEEAGKQMGEFAARHPEMVDENFTKEMGDDQVRGFMSALEGRADKSAVLDKLPKATRETMAKALESGWTSSEEYTMLGSLKDSIGRTP